MTKPTDNLIAGRPLIRLGNVSTPTLTWYAPHPLGGATPSAPAPAVVVLPGGGYQIAYPSLSRDTLVTNSSWSL